MNEYKGLACTRIEDPTFDIVRGSFNATFQKLFLQMETYQAEQGKLNLTINVEMEKKMVNTADGNVKILNIPQFTFKCTSSVQHKYTIEDEVCNEKAIIHDKDLGFILRTVEDNQMTIEDFNE